MTVRLRGDAPPPEAPFPVLPLRSGVLLPGTTQTFAVGRAQTIALVRDAHVNDVVAVVTQATPSTKVPEFEDLHPVGTFGRIVRIARQGDRGYRLTVEGLGRVQLSQLTQREPYLRGNGQVLAESSADTDEARLLADALRQRVQSLAENMGAGLELSEGDEPSVVADRVAAGLMMETEDAATALAATDVVDRLRFVLERLAHAQALAELKVKIEKDVREQFGQHQREAILRQQLKAIRRELGDGDGDGADEVETLRARLEEADLPDEVRAIGQRELSRLESSGGQGPESNVIRTYVTWLLELPWNARAPVREDLNAISTQLEADHYGLDDVKKRILEHMAVQKLSGNPRGTILCLVGPPGVGKTSLGRSIADATERPFVRVSLGGVRDEAEIRGHRRTYVGALPGRILSVLRNAKVKNPVVLLDEIDKLAGGWAGWPEAALLEVLDPSQNKTFTDHYIDTPFDLSEVLFVCTANTLDTLSAPLRDRLEIIELSGYTHAEKAVIARRHLLPKRLEETGVPTAVLNVQDDALDTIVHDYTREAGVRQLDRELGRVTRAVALQVARQENDAPLRVTLTAARVAEYLGKPRFFSDVAERTAVPGVATGLAWTPVGGDILFIETSKMSGKGRLEITGKLGDVMKESARAALTYVRSHAEELGVEPRAIDSVDLHIHVPAGAVPKDGPSAGVTIFTALASLLSNRRVRSDTAMTGEVTLRGKVLPVGGIKAKVLAAHRAGITRIVLPKQNERDLDEVPESVRQGLEICFASDMGEVLEAALEPLEVQELPGATPPVSNDDSISAA